MTVHGANHEAHPLQRAVLVRVRVESWWTRKASGRAGRAARRSRRLLARSGPGHRRKAAPAEDQEVAEPVADLDQVLHAPERGPGPGELVGLLGDAHETHGPPMRAEDREELLRLGDRAAQVALAVLDQERRPHPRAV